MGRVDRVGEGRTRRQNIILESHTIHDIQEKENLDIKALRISQEITNKQHAAPPLPKKGV